MKNIHILCAMRSRETALALRRELEGSAHIDVEIAPTGDSAYVHICRFGADILVADAVLEGMDGPGLMDRLRKRLGEGMPRVIGGAMTDFTRSAFLARGAKAVVDLPWDRQQLIAAVRAQIAELECSIDWDNAQAAYLRAAQLLRQIGMRDSLKGFDYLAWAAALAHQQQSRMDCVSQWLYAPIAKRFGTTPQSVERLIRHAVESAMDAIGAGAVYSFFGNTIDPTRGKPTNAQMLGLLVQRMRVG